MPTSSKDSSISGCGSRKIWGLCPRSMVNEFLSPQNRAYMNGASAEPSANTNSAPISKIGIMTGNSHHFLRARAKAQNSWIKLVFAMTVTSVSRPVVSRDLPLRPPQRSQRVLLLLLWSRAPRFIVPDGGLRGPAAVVGTHPGRLPEDETPGPPDR